MIIAPIPDQAAGPPRPGKLPDATGSLESILRSNADNQYIHEAMAMKGRAIRIIGLQARAHAAVHLDHPDLVTTPSLRPASEDVDFTCTEGTSGISDTPAAALHVLAMSWRTPWEFPLGCAVIWMSASFSAHRRYLVSWPADMTWSQRYRGPFQVIDITPHVPMQK